MNKNDTTFSRVAELVDKFNKTRNWNKSHNPKNLAISISLEAAELLEHFQWLDMDNSRQYIENVENIDNIIDEIADIVIYCMCFSNEIGVDLGQAVLNKLNKNGTKYPIK